MTTVNDTDFDLIIIGGGMVGASLAVSLAEQNMRIAIIEAAAMRRDASNTSQNTPPNYDDRAIALSYGSRRIFEGMNLWADIAPHCTAIKHIHVSDKGRFGFTRLDSQQENVDALGYVATARQLGISLMSKLEDCKNLTIFSETKLVELKLGDEHATAVVSREDVESEALTGKLIVAADGGNSSVRQLLDIQTTNRDYKQTAIVANITPQKSHRNVAYERFTRNGPLALLPMPDNRCSLVWTREPSDVERVMSLDDDAFLAELQSNFGKRLGRLIKVGKRHSYPLQLVRAKEQIRQRLALIGNAAHTLHPIAGQGFNLGLRDVATLAQSITDATTQHQDIGSQTVLNNYAQWRERDHRQVIGFTDTLVDTFSNRFPPLVLARNLGLVATDILPPLKHLLARHAMGIAGKLPRLARGLKL